MSRSRQRQASLPGFDLADLRAEAIDFLRRHEPPEGYFVGFSGGKDSIVTLDLCRMAGVRHQAYYSCTRIDPPEVMRFIRREYPEAVWLYPEASFWRLIVKTCPPQRYRRWCCDDLKKAPSERVPLRHRLMGIRAEESHRRASRPRIDPFKGKWTVYKPVLHWPEWAVWEHIEARRLAYPSLYDEGWHRIGCVVCPYILGASPGAVRQRERSMRRWPGMWRAFEHAVKRWWNLRRAQRPDCDMPEKTAEAFWERYLNGFEKQ